MSASAAPGTIRTYKVVPKSMRPRIVDKLGSPALSMGREGIFFVFFGSLVSSGPESAPLIHGRPAARRNFVKVLNAAVAFWRVVRGLRAVFDGGWFSRMGVFPNGLKRSCVRTSHKKSPLLLKEMGTVCDRCAASVPRLRQAVAADSLPARAVGMGGHLGDAIAVRSAAAMAVAFVGIRRAPEAAEPSMGDVRVATEAAGGAEGKPSGERPVWSGAAVPSFWRPSPGGRRGPSDALLVGGGFDRGSKRSETFRIG